MREDRVYIDSMIWQPNWVKNYKNAIFRPFAETNKKWRMFLKFVSFFDIRVTVVILFTENAYICKNIIIQWWENLTLVHELCKNLQRFTSECTFLIWQPFEVQVYFINNLQFVPFWKHGYQKRKKKKKVFGDRDIIYCL